MGIRFIGALAPVFVLFLNAVGHAAAQDYPGYSYTIMAPEHRAAAHRRAATSRRAARTRPEQATRRSAGHQARRIIAVVRGSSGSVLRAPLPRTPLIPPEASGSAEVRVAPQEQGPAAVPGFANPVPNLPHGTEMFQDRASRCVMQQGVYDVPGGAITPYMGACLQ